MTDEPSKLNPKQEKFVLAYVGEARFNATKAAKMAGYSERSAYSTGHELLKNPEIAARVKDVLDVHRLSAEAVLSELADIATAEWREFVVVRLNPKTGEKLEVKMDLNAKVRSLELLARAHGLLKDNVAVTGNVGIYSFDGIPEDAP